jgi:hypothetical protein
LILQGRHQGDEYKSDVGKYGPELRPVIIAAQFTQQLPQRPLKARHYPKDIIAVTANPDKNSSETFLYFSFRRIIQKLTGLYPQ